MFHFAARYYDLNIGRFTSPDPSGHGWGFINAL
ncbi:hypothetical protein GRQ63_32230 [Streptomyces sp. YIM 132580]|nr:hypothetical protein [Streptomyces sp. YIM 132580]NYS21423.1 hypothetical protein [Streptomyces sp. SJ1-7]